MNNYFAPNAKHKKLKLPPSSRVSHTAVPPLHKFEGTHSVRFAWGNTQHSHRYGHFSHYATALCAPASHPNGAVACTFPSSSALPFLAALRLVFRLRNYTFRL